MYQLLTDLLTQKPSLTRKHLSNIRNAAESTGPRTAEGKARSACNAVKHGLTGQKLILQRDEFADYFTQGIELIEDLRPVGAYEIQLVQKIIDHNWRINRCSMLENNLVAEALATYVDPAETCDPRTAAVFAQVHGFQSDCNGPNAWEKLSRIGSRLNREMLRLTRELNERQTTRLKGAENQWVREDCKAWNIYTDALRAHEESERLCSIATAALTHLQTPEEENTSELASFRQKGNSNEGLSNSGHSSNPLRESAVHTQSFSRGPLAAAHATQP